MDVRLNFAPVEIHLKLKMPGFHNFGLLLNDEFDVRLGIYRKLCSVLIGSVIGISNTDESRKLMVSKRFKR